jgi:hypothetical protein
MSSKELIVFFGRWTSSTVIEASSLSFSNPRELIIGKIGQTESYQGVRSGKHNYFGLEM